MTLSLFRENYECYYAIDTVRVGRFEMGGLYGYPLLSTTHLYFAKITEYLLERIAIISPKELPVKAL